MSSNTVANSDTPGFVPGGVAQETLPQEGVSAQPIENPPGTDLAAETINQIADVSTFQANLKSIEAEESTDKALMDIHA